jgi:hypothetical protein
MDGWIRVAREPAKRLPLGQWRYMAMLLPYPASPSPIAQLHAMELVQWDLRGLVLRGLEEFLQRKQRTDYRQAWWVVPLVGSDVATPRNPIDDAEELEQIEQAMHHGHFNNPRASQSNIPRLSHATSTRGVEERKVVNASWAFYHS